MGLWLVINLEQYDSLEGDEGATGIRVRIDAKLKLD
jgi:hypothetical protein